MSELSSEDRPDLEENHLFLGSKAVALKQVLDKSREWQECSVGGDNLPTGGPPSPGRCSTKYMLDKTDVMLVPICSLSWTLVCGM